VSSLLVSTKILLICISQDMLRALALSSCCRSSADMLSRDCSAGKLHCQIVAALRVSFYLTQCCLLMPDDNSTGSSSCKLPATDDCLPSLCALSSFSPACQADIGLSLLANNRGCYWRQVDSNDSADRHSSENCQSALKIDPPSASNIDPPKRVMFA